MWTRASPCSNRSGAHCGGILPIILVHHDRFDGSGYNPRTGEQIPLAARIISVADVYDSLTSDRPCRKAMSPFEVREILVKGAGTEFDPNVVEAFLIAFRKGDMKVPAVVICPPPQPPKSPTPNPRR